MTRVERKEVNGLRKGGVLELALVRRSWLRRVALGNVFEKV